MDPDTEMELIPALYLEFEPGVVVAGPSSQLRAHVGLRDDPGLTEAHAVVKLTPGAVRLEVAVEYVHGKTARRHLVHGV